MSHGCSTLNHYIATSFIAFKTVGVELIVLFPVSNSNVMLSLLMLGLEMYCCKVRQGSPMNSPGHGAEDELTT